MPWVRYIGMWASTDRSKCFGPIAKLARRRSTLRTQACCSSGEANCNPSPSQRSEARLCVCVKSNIVNQLHPARMGYGSCWVFRLYSPPQSCPQTTFLCTEVQGPAVKAGHLDLLPPKSLPEEKPGCSGPTADPGQPRTQASRGSTDGPAVFRANRGSRPSTDGPPHAKFPTVHSKDHTLYSITAPTTITTNSPRFSLQCCKIAHPCE